MQTNAKDYPSVIAGLAPWAFSPRVQNRIPATALTVPTASAMPEAATHAMGETASAAVGHAMAEAVAEFAVPAIVGAVG